MKALILPLSFAALVACGESPTLDSNSEAMIDCLAAKTALEVSQTVKAGIEAGKSPEDLSSVQNDVTEANVDVLKQVFPDQQQQTYFEYQTAKRLNAVQDALANPNGAAEAKAMMDETFAMARDCTFGPTT